MKDYEREELINRLQHDMEILRQHVDDDTEVYQVAGTFRILIGYLRDLHYRALNGERVGFTGEEQ